jgi:8-oxo-dGTP pyrophosphatase MutT (NUDIX family)
MANQELDRELHRVALTAIIHKDGKYLITQRSPHKKAFPGLWTVPGGGLHPDDYTAQPETYPKQWYMGVESSLRREVSEEVGLTIGKPKFLLDIVLIRPDGIQVVVLSYYAEYVSGEVKLDDESTASAWVSYEEAKSYDLIPGILGELEMVERLLAGEDAADVGYRVHK